MKLKTLYNDSRGIILILLLAAALRLWAAFLYGDMWADEMFSFVYSQQSWAKSLQYWILETNPPLHMFLLKIWLTILPNTEFVMRLLSILFGLFGIVALYMLAKKMFNKKIALYTALLLSLHSYHIFSSATIRAYAMLIAVTIVTTYFFYTLFIQEQKSRTTIIWYMVCTTALLYTHLTALGILASFWIVLLSLKKNARQWIYCTLPSIILWMLWSVPSAINKLHSESAQLSWYFLINDAHHSTQTLQSLFTGYDNKIFSFCIIIFFITGLIISMKKSLQNKKTSILIISILLIVPFIGISFLGLWNIKFITIIIPWVALLGAYILVTYVPASVRIALIGLIYIPGLINLYINFLPIQDWNTVNNYISNKYNNEKKQLLINDDLLSIQQMGRYYTATIPVSHYYTLEQGQTLDEKIIAENYWAYKRKNEELEQWARDQSLTSYDEIFILSMKEEQINFVPVLQTYGWKISDIFYPRLMGSAKLYYLSKT